jgi:opacity protein-like surface antigen
MVINVLAIIDLLLAIKLLDNLKRKVNYKDNRMSRALCTAFFFFCVNAVNAGDMGPAPYDFNGFYIGAGTGFTDFFIKNTDAVSGIPHLGDRNNINAIMFDGTLGYGVMINKHFYLGTKASVYYSPINETGNDDSTVILNELLSTRHRATYFNAKPTFLIDLVLGYEFIPHIMPFIEGGVSFANLAQNTDVTRGYANLIDNSSISETHVHHIDNYTVDYNLGIGLNYQPRYNWVLSTELVYNHLGSHSNTVSTTIPSPLTYTRSQIADSISLLGGISYFFG